MHHDNIVNKAKKIPSADLVDEHVYDESPLPPLEPPGAEPSREVEHGGERKNDDGNHDNKDLDVSHGCDCDASFQCDRDGDVSNHCDNNKDDCKKDNNDSTTSNYADNDASNHHDGRDVKGSCHVDGEAGKQEGRGG